MSLARFVLCVAVACGRVDLGDRAGAGRGCSSRTIARSRAQDCRQRCTRDRQSCRSANDPLTVDPDLAILDVVMFVVLLAVLWKFAWGPIIGGAREARARHRRPHRRGRAQPRGGQAAAGAVRAEAGRGRRRGARVDGAGPPRRRARRAGRSWPRPSRAPRPSAIGPCTRSKRQPTGPWSRWPSAARNWRSNWPARSSSRN